MRNIEVRYGVTDLRGEPEPACDGIRKGIASDGCGIVVHRFAVSVRTPELEVVARPFLDIHLKRLVGGAGPIRHEPDSPKVRVGPQIESVAVHIERVRRPEVPP